MRTNGILMPIFSLPSAYGIGTFGKEAYRFIDFLEKSGQSYWQILPLNPTNYGDSPYQSFSSFAGNPYFIDIEMLIDEGLLTKAEADSFDFGDDEERIDYEKLYNGRYKLLEIAFSRFKTNKDYFMFIKENAFWLEDYALFMALKTDNDYKPWYMWDKSLKLRDETALHKAKENLRYSIDFQLFIQYKFAEQWKKLKKYANSKNIGIIGDIPIYVAFDSADVWSSPKQFLLNEDLEPEFVAGCPPDAFSADGQLWGNPLYDWQHMKKDRYSWWKKYLGHALSRYDVTRIDHFRGFESFYAIPFGDKTAANGKWLKGPNIDLFDELKTHFGENLPIIAEDLGLLTDSVYEMLKNTGFPGMKVLQFAFDEALESDYLPHNIVRNCVVYTGTHDNDTINGWLKSATKTEVHNAMRYFGCNTTDNFNWVMIKGAMRTVADMCIIMMNDIIGLGSEARINTPSTLGNNWQWRINRFCINDWLAEIIRENTSLYGRIPKKAKINSNENPSAK